MFSLEEYFPFVFKQTTLESEESLLVDKEPAMDRFIAARSKFAATLKQLSNSDRNLRIFLNNDNSLLDGKENTALLKKLSTDDAKQKYHSYIKASQRQREIDQQLQVHKDTKEYLHNKRLLNSILERINNNELEQLKETTTQLLQYVDQHLNFISKSQLNDIILSLIELFEPTDIKDVTRDSIHIQKARVHLSFDPPCFVKYDYDFESSRRYFNFARHVDQVSGARKHIDERDINDCLASLAIIFTLALCFCCIGLAVVGGGEVIGLAIPVFCSIGMLTGLAALSIHLNYYPRTGLSKQLAIVADAALNIENKRLEHAERDRDNPIYREKFQRLKDMEPNFNGLLERAVQFINDNYYQAESPQKALLLLNHLQAALEAKSHEDFTTHSNKLIRALNIPQRKSFFSLKSQKINIPKDILQLLYAVQKPLLEKEKTEQNQRQNQRLDAYIQ